jgi:MraZ protein
MDPLSKSSVRAFHGHSPVALDAKSRVTVPARWRYAGMDELLALPDGAQQVLRLMPREVLTDMLTKVQASEALSEPEKLAVIRLTSARAFPCSLDKQGRLSLPPTHVERLGLSGEVLLVGAWTHIEVWRPDDWESYSGKAESLLAVGAQTVGI